MAGLVEGPRARNAFLLRCSLSPPWAVRVQDGAPVAVLAVARGQAWLVLDGADAIRLGAGDVAVLGPHPYLVADEFDRAPQAIILPDGRCVNPDGIEPSSMSELGIRSWGNSPDGTTELLTGTYRDVGEVSRHLLWILPPAVVLRSNEWNCPVIPLLAEEIVKDQPGQEAVLDRLLDVLLIAALRAWFARPDAPAPSWYQAYDDPVVGLALRHLYRAPEYAWTLRCLADAVGVSRATLARRFAELVGETPMTFLTAWRIALAADLLRDGHTTLATIARRVGYSSPYALSIAFKRVRGVSPREYRATTTRRSRREKLSRPMHQDL